MGALPGTAKLVWCLRNNYTFAAMDFGRRLGASDEHIPKWICEEQATTPPTKRHPALRVALKLALGLRCSVGRVSLGIHSLPRASPQANLSATNVWLFRRHHTSTATKNFLLLAETGKEPVPVKLRPVS